MTDLEMMTAAYKLIAAAHEVLQLGKKHGKPKQALTSIYVIARIIVRDMRESAEGWDEAKVDMLEAAVRADIEKIYTAGWVRQ